MSAYILRLGGFLFFFSISGADFYFGSQGDSKRTEGKEERQPDSALASVRREGKGVRIRLPNVNLSAAAAVRADTSIARCSPALDICLAANEPEITGTLITAVLWCVSPQLMEILGDPPSLCSLVTCTQIVAGSTSPQRVLVLSPAVNAASMDSYIAYQCAG
jgi:hypothetical protein